MTGSNDEKVLKNSFFQVLGFSAISSKAQISSCATAASPLCARSMLGWEMKGRGIKSALFSGAAKGRRAVNIDWWIYGPAAACVGGKYDQSEANTVGPLCSDSWGLLESRSKKINLSSIQLNWFRVKISPSVVSLKRAQSIAFSHNGPICENQSLHRTLSPNAWDKEGFKR